MSKLNFFEKTLILLWLSALIVALIYLVFSKLNFDIFFNSDTLYLPSIYTDIFVDGNGMAGWQLNAAPNFFPDMVAYFIIHWLCGGNFIVAFFVFPLVQFFGIMILLFVILKKLTPNESFIAKYTLGILFISLIFLAHVYFDHFDAAFQLINNSYHFGAFVNTLLAALLVLSYFKKERNRTLYLLLVIIVLATISDKLFIVQFVFPSLVILGIRFFSLKEKMSRNLALKIAGSMVLGWLIFRVIQKIDYINFSTSSTLFSFDQIGVSFQILMDHNWSILSSSIIGFLIVVIPFISLGFMLFMIIKKLVIKKLDAKFYYQLALFLFLAATIFAPVLTGSYEGIDCIRYTIGFYVVGLFVFPFILLHKVKVNQKVLVAIPLSLFSFWVLPNLSGTLKSSMESYFNYQNSYSTILDELTEEHNLKAGIADYWFAKKNMMFSSKDVKVYSVYKDLHMYTHVTNRNWFRVTPDGDQVVFNFVIIDSEEKLKKVKEQFKEVEIIQKGEVRICKTPDFVYPGDKTFFSILNNVEE